MTTYQLINENLAVIVQLIRNRILPDATVVTHINIYERFIELEGNKSERYKKLGEEFKMNHKHIQRIILKLNKNAR